MKTKSATRQAAEELQKLTGASLLSIGFYAGQYVKGGLCETLDEAIKYMIEVQTMAPGTQDGDE